MTIRKCKECESPIPTEKKRNIFCSSSCSAKHSNKHKIKELPQCLVCDNKVSKLDRKYCSSECMGFDFHAKAVEEWKSGKSSGLSSNGTVSGAIRKYVLGKYDNKCCLCGWNRVNPHTKKVPLVIDHIDGNYLNNTESNLRAICWNCDSLGSTFGGLNKGKGRTLRLPAGAL